MQPIEIKVHKKTSELELVYLDNKAFKLSFEFLRVHSPSAEVRGHGKGNEVLQHSKRNVQLINIEPAGNYALKLVFDDGHDSGLYDWDYLYQMCQQFDDMWSAYLNKLEKAGLSRDNNFINIMKN
jgi:DUF971 family protein